MKLQTKIVVFLGGGLLAVGLLVATLIGVRTWYSISEQTNKQSLSQINLTTNLLDSYRVQTERLAVDHLKVLAQTLSGDWRLGAEEAIATGGKTFPALRLNGRAVNNDFSLPDRFTQSYGSIATLFVHVGNDFHRVSTSLKKEDGQRAVGTALGNAHPAYASLSKGEPFVGKAKLFGRDYMTSISRSRTSVAR